MKPLSFIALFFYLGSLFPAAQFSVAHNWLDAQKTNPVHGFTQATSSVQPIKHADLSGDSDKALVQWHKVDLSPVVAGESSVVVVLFYAATVRCFSARAPPLYWS